MPVYFPGMRSDNTPSFCDTDEDEIYDEGEEGVPYEEWRLNGDPLSEECDPRDYENGSCIITLIECREVVKPIVSTYLQKVDLSQAGFYPERFAYDVFTAVSRDDGATWKRMNVSRMADLSSFDLLTGEPFPGTCRSPQMKVVDNGDHFLKVPWNVNPEGNSDNWEQGELVWRYDFLAHGEEEQGECQLRATSDGSKMYAIWHQMIPEEADPDAELTRWYP
jgi:hypothetical protein